MKDSEIIVWNFAGSKDKVDYLNHLVISKIKTATSSIYDGELPIIGEINIISDSDGNHVAAIKIIDYKVLPFKDITEEMALKEGEGSFFDWKIEHSSFFKKYDNFNDETLVLFEEFELLNIF